MSKVHGIFLWLGFGGYIIFYRRDLLKSPMLWISVVISLVNHISDLSVEPRKSFYNLHYHQGRISFWGSKPDMDHLLQQVLGSVFYNNPVNFVLYITD